MFKILKNLKPYALKLLLLVCLTYVQVMATLKLPDYMAQIVNEGIVAEDTNLIIHKGVDMLLVSLLGGVCMIIISYLASLIAAGFSKDVRKKVFSKVSGFSLYEFNKFSTASLITRSTNDIQQIQMVVVMMLRMVLMAPIMGIGATIKAYRIAPDMTWLMAVAVSIMFAFIFIMFSIALPKFKMLQALLDKLNLVTRQILTGLRVVRAFNTEKFEEQKFDKTNSELTKVNLFVNRLMVIIFPIMMLVLNFTSLAVIWVGSHLIDLNKLAIGDMMAFLQYSMQTIMSFLLLSVIFIIIPRASVSAERIYEVLETKNSIKDPEKSILSKKKKGVIDFKNVYFSYHNADIPALEDISFTANPGETTALIGSTGSGKSTILDLILRFYEVTSGEVLVDGVNVKDIKQETLWRKVGYVPQRGVLFSGTVESNIKFGAPKATKKQIEKAVKVAQAYSFIKNFPKKFQNPIAQGGANVSGGQKQRLSIARAIVRQPEIYIFDDSFSALDFRTDAALRAALLKEIKNKTVLIVAQRISTIMNAEKIIVLDEGRIVGVGTHRELMKFCQVYKEIALSQLSEKELNDIDIKSIKPEIAKEAA